ncbi:MAG: hypothetical protein GY835_06640 [bacterium]|nr:hypothetical protein [bacterium]
MKSISLNDHGYFSSLDPDGMLTRVSGFPGAFAAAWAAGCPSLPGLLPRRLLSGGMGGSAIAGNLVASILADTAGPIPISIRDYTLPPTTDGDLLLLCSYSGNTEETLSLFSEAEERGLPMILMAAGGNLRDMAGDSYPFVPLPPGSPPRAALPSMLGSYLAVVRELGLYRPAPGEIDEAIMAMNEVVAVCAPEIPIADNPAKTLAVALGDDRAVCVALTPAYEAVALRLRCQFEENAKVFALTRSLPEMHHNSWIPWIGGDRLGRPLWLGAADSHPRTQLRRRLTDELLEAQEGLGGLELPVRGEGKLARLLTNLLLGDFLSVYHALLHEVDPTPVDDLTTMKGRLANLTMSDD